jgi:hypothetical protein
VVGLWIAVGDVDHLLAQLLDKDRTWSVSHLTGPGSLGNHAETVTGWEFFRTTAGSGTYAADTTTWLHAYALFDWALVATYLALAVIWARSSLTPARVGVLVAIGFGGLADAAENLLIWDGAKHTTLLVVAAWLKWLPLAAGAIGALVISRRQVGRALRYLPSALYTHRYSVLVVLPVALLSLGRGPDLLEQLPDIQRRWADSDEGGDFWAASVATLALSAAVLAIGRQRIDHLWLRTCPMWVETGHPCARRRPADPETCRVVLAQGVDQPMPWLRLWFMGSGLFLTTGLVLELFTDAAVVWWRLVPFAAVPAVIGFWSLRLRRRQVPETSTPSYRRYRPALSMTRFRVAALTGDVLAVLLPVVAGLGAIRAFTSVIALGESNLVGKALFVVGWAGLVLPWWAFAAGLERLHVGARTVKNQPVTVGSRLMVALTPGLRMELDAEQQQARLLFRTAHPRRAWLREFLDQPVAWGAMVLSLLTLAWVGCWPVWWGESAGVVATFQVALGSLSILIAATVILVQRGEGPEVFWRFGIPYAPVTALLVTTALAIGLVGKLSDVHAIRDYEGAEAALDDDSRPSLDTVFDTWLANGGTCASDLPGTDLSVRPLMLYAAEGGGIRAAYWTAATVDRISTEVSDDATVDPICRSAMISSGASGGSVGLSIASVLDPGKARKAVSEISGPAALGAASDGLVVRDTIFAATGIALPSVGDHVERAHPWDDRGTLIEQAWEHGIPELATTPWLQSGRKEAWTWGPTGALIVNSTSPTTSCRTLVSQVELPGKRPDCSTDAAAPGSTDLVECTDQMRTTTAALLTARFPYVTPSGVVDCSTEDTGDPDIKLQVVDGGYGDNTGVGTLVDIGSRLMARVREHNTCVLASAATPPREAAGCTDDPATSTLVVPVLVYFDNGSGSDLVTSPGGLDLEVLVPPITILGAKSALVSASSELQRASAMFGTTQLWAPGDVSAAISTAVDAWRGPPVFVVYQPTKPSIAAPLGWVLSGTSMDAMDDALAQQAPVCRLAPDTTAKDGIKVPLFGSIDGLLTLLPGSIQRSSTPGCAD